MKKILPVLRSTLVTAGVLAAAFALSLWFQDGLNIPEHVTTLFVFAVFLISLWTEGYVWGIAAAVIGTLAVNYAFTFPYFSLSFSAPGNLVSTVVMITVSLLASATTMRSRRHDLLKAESEKERMRANLLRGVSHDLRTPLTTIYGSSSALLENREQLTEEQQVKMLTGIKEDAQWLVRMVENLLSITRIDSGKVKILKTPTVLEELVDSVLVKFRKRYPGRSIELDIPEELVVIPMDAILIEQVILNILENAVQHAAGMQHLLLRVFTLGGQAIFEVRDDGCGIRPDRLDKIFSGLYDSSTAPADGRKRNAGIGLSVCATIIKAHGGSISAENARGGGAVFRFTLSTEDVSNE